MTHVLESAWRSGPGRLDPVRPHGYAHLPLAVIDAIFSIRANDASADHAVRRYAERFGIRDLGNDRRSDEEFGLDQLVASLEGLDATALVGLFCDNDRLAARLKATAVPEAAAALVGAGVVHGRDLADPRTDPEAARAQEEVWTSVRGCGVLSWRTVLQLSGVPEGQPEATVQRWVEEVLGPEQERDAGEELEGLAAAVGVDRLAVDHAIVRYQRQR